MCLQRRFGNSQGIDTTLDDIQRLSSGVVGECSLSGSADRPNQLVPEVRVRPNRRITEFDFLLYGVLNFGSLGRDRQLQAQRL